MISPRDSGSSSPAPPLFPNMLLLLAWNESFEPDREAAVGVDSSNRLALCISCGFLPSVSFVKPEIYDCSGRRKLPSPRYAFSSYLTVIQLRDNAAPQTDGHLHHPGRGHRGDTSPSISKVLTRSRQTYHASQVRLRRQTSYNTSPDHLFFRLP